METKAEVWIPLTQGKVAVVDFDDFEKVRPFKWFTKRNKNVFYAVRKGRIDGKRVQIPMPSELLGLPVEIWADHKNGDGLDNRRDNLRPCTNAENQWGFRTKNPDATSSYRGVTWHKKLKKWQTQIQVLGKSYYLGVYVVEEDAAHTYDAAALKFFGEWAQLNFSKAI